MDRYNVFGGVHDLDELVSIVTSLPGQQLVDTLGKAGTPSRNSTGSASRPGG